MRTSDQTQRIPGSYKRRASVESHEGNKNNASVADSTLLSGELSLVDKNSPNLTRASNMIPVIRGFDSRLQKNKKYETNVRATLRNDAPIVGREIYH